MLRILCASRAGQATVVMLLFVTMAVSVGSGYYFSVVRSEEVAESVMERYLEHEYDRVWGQQNYELMLEATRLSAEEQIPQLRQYLRQRWANVENDTENTSNTGGQSGAVNTRTTSEQTIEAIKSSAYILGDADARLLMLEYSDLECPFCIRQYRDGTIDAVRAEYGDQIAFAFRNHRGVNHSGTEAKAEAVLCAGEIGGTEKYYEYTHAILDGSDTQGGVYSVSDLDTLAGEIGLDVEAFAECRASDRNIAKFNAETQEGRQFGVWGTPGTVIIDTETNEYVVVEGAYPVSEFTRQIDGLLGAQ